MKKFKILHTNDTHSYLNNFHKRKHFVDSKRLETENVLLVDAGDNLRGSLYYAIFHGEKEPYLLNKLGYDYITLGNHEFDNGSKDVYQFVKKLDSKVVLSNVLFNEDQYLKKWKNHYRYVIHQFDDGIKVGIFGLLTETTPFSSSPSKQTHFLNVVDTAKEMIVCLKSQKVDVIILLSHLGDDADLLLAQQVSGIHYIIGSHTHKVIEQPIIVTHSDGWQTAIMQAGMYGNYIGEIDVILEEDTAVLNAYHLTDLRHYVDYDTELAQEIDQWNEQIETIAYRCVATLEEDLVGQREIMKIQSTNLTNLVTDAYFDYAVSLGFQPDIAIMNSGGIRQSLLKGDVKYADVLQTLPFACELVLCELTGEELFHSLNEGEYPQVSHAKITYEQTKQGVQLIDVQIKGQNGYEPLDWTKKYLVVTNSFIASGKNGYLGFEYKKNLITESILDTEILASYLQKLQQPIKYTDEVRKAIKVIS